MVFVKQNPFTKKPADLPDVPSPNYTPTDIKSYFQTPHDELMATVNNLVDDLNASGWVDTSKLGTEAVTREKIATGAIGTNEIDPAIMSEPTTVVGVQAKLADHDAQLADNAKKLKGNFYIDNYEHLIPNKNTASTPSEWDWTEAFKAVLADVKAYGNSSIYSGKKRIIFQNGQYKLRTILIENVFNVHLVGQGIEATQLLLNNVDGNVMFQLSQLDISSTDYFNGTAGGFSLSNLSIRHELDDSLNMSGMRTATAIEDNGCGSVSLNHVKFRGFKRGYFASKGGDFTRIVNCSINNCDEGIYFGLGSQQYVVEKTDFMLCGECIIFEGAPQGIVRDCTFINSRVSDIVIENNTVTRAGITSNYSVEYNLSIDDCWFETAAGGMDLTSYNWVFKHHIHIKGDKSSPIMKGVKIHRPILVSGSLGYPIREVGQDYSFLRVENGTNYKLEDLTLSGDRITCVVSIASNFYPRLIQKDTRLEEGVSIPLWNRFGDDGLVEINSFDKTLKSGLNTTYQEFNRGGNDAFRIRQDANGVITFTYKIGSTWYERLKFDTQNSEVILNGNKITYRTAMPTSGAWTIGDVVYNKGTDISTVGGWRRLTTGSTHVLGTDWKSF